MGNQKQKWTQDEEDALIAGVEKHGPGKWKNILKDPQFAPFLTSRSNIDLKDKWRNLSVSNGTQGSKEKSRVTKLKAAAPSSAPVPTATLTNAAATAASLPHQTAPSSDVIMCDADSQNDHDVKNPPRYNAMVFEALSTLKDPNGSDLNAIVSFIEQKHKVPQNFRRALSTRLRRLVSQGKLEKVQNCYKIKKDASLGTKSPAPKQKDVWPQRQSPASGLMASNETIKESADTAACRVADAESKSYLAAEAVREVERISCIAEYSDSMLQLAKEIYEQCSRGEIFLLA